MTLSGNKPALRRETPSVRRIKPGSLLTSGEDGEVTFVLSWKEPELVQPPLALRNHIEIEFLIEE